MLGLPAGAAGEIRLLAFGDSLTSGWGLQADDAFPARLERALHEAGRKDVRVIAAGVAGDTSAGGRARLGWSLADRPHAAIVELGANDGLRGIDPAVTRDNLDAILTELKRRGIPVLLAGMYAPPNLGREYGAAFNAIYPGLAGKHGVRLYPFFPRRRRRRAGSQPARRAPSQCRRRGRYRGADPALCYAGAAVTGRVP